MEAPGADDLVNVADKRKLTVIPGALLGGSKAQKKLRMNEPIIGRNALRYCNSVLDSTWIGVEGPMVKRLERMLARICGCSQACAVQSGTAALYGAVKALGVGRREHHVICPTYTCAACADAVVHAGGTPIAVDCEMETFGLDLGAVRRALEADPQVVGVVVAPCYGVPMRDFLAIRELCHARGLWICEDNCESYGAMMRSEASSKALVPAGFLGDISVISVRSEKMVGVGEGGAILSRDPALVSKARWWCARAPCRGVGLWRVYDHEDVGQNYRLPEMLAAVGVAAAENLPVMIESKQRIHDMYKSAVMGATGGEGLRMQGSHPDERPVWWLNCIMIPEDSKFGAEDLGMQIMHDHPEVEIRPAFYPLHMMKPFMEKAQACPNAEQVYRRLLCVPSSGLLLDEDVRHVASCVIKAYASRRAGIVNGAH
jgi:perosamine synthetase